MQACMSRTPRALLAVLLVLGLSRPAPAFELQIIHSSDNESAFVDPATLEPRILNYAAIVEGLRAIAPNGGANSIHLTAGDHTLPGPFYRAAAEVPSLGARGLGDIAIYNALRLVANGMGNHEFDGGIDDFARMLAAANYPFIAANLDFGAVRVSGGAPPIRIGRDGGSIAENAGKVVRSAYVEVAGERIGIVSRAPADFFNVVADPDQTLPGLDFFGGRDPANNQPRVPALEQVMEQVRLLEADGIDKIVLVDHAQDYTSDPLSARRLRGVDVVITAGSTGFLAKQPADGPFNLLRPGRAPTGPYPLTLSDAEGWPILVVNTDQNYTAVGHLIVRFDEAGHIAAADPRSGPIATTREAVEALGRIVGRPLAPPAEVERVYASLTATPLIAGLMRVVGETAAPLNGERADVRTRETNLGRLTADATLWYARGALPDRRIDLALKNGGGIRASLPAPQITGFTIASALAFDNRTAVVEVSGAALLAILENAVSRIPSADGRFPQLAGALVEYDPSRPGLSDQLSLTAPSRIRRLAIARADGSSDLLVDDFAPVGNLDRTFTIATNDFLLNGGDGYRALKAAAAGATLLESREQQVLIDYLTQALGGSVALVDPPPAPRVISAGP